MNIPIRSSATDDAYGEAGRWITRTVLPAGLLTGGLALSARAAEAAYSVSVKHRTPTITGNSARQPNFFTAGGHSLSAVAAVQLDRATERSPCAQRGCIRRCGIRRRVTPHTSDQPTQKGITHVP